MYKFKFENIVDYFLFFMLIVKLVFLISSLAHVITLKSSNPKIQQYELLMRRISERTEMVFIFGMSAFLIYFFFPNKKDFDITRETAILLFTYGIVMLIGAFKKYHFPPHMIELNMKKKNSNTQQNYFLRN